ncbi:hypothetical protein OCGS_1656 [Oceaniovalibus guishaninsula JLT2003]|uniref:DUF1150 family protein n=1 Tax=Oceaniovalibus guishaninsula JLT2003 TaxID=1231392 RepID=K2I5H7_9RHOB|nr:DUF1150 family protein [Oceaniovalibus guishaninsula]EKE44140.1 hypothetical protein OCGS_1656 [Oceaniovalibus guishaninsula JLT2003]
MTHHQQSFAEGADNIVYIRPVNVSELPTEVQQQADGLERIYAVHSATGDRLALVRDRDLAFIVARQNDMAPVSVH